MEKSTKLYPATRALGEQLCGGPDRLDEIMAMKNLKAEYWQGIKDAIKAHDKLMREGKIAMYKLDPDRCRCQTCEPTPRCSKCGHLMKIQKRRLSLNGTRITTWSCGCKGGN